MEQPTYITPLTLQLPPTCRSKNRDICPSGSSCDSPTYNASPAVHSVCRRTALKQLAAIVALLPATPVSCLTDCKRLVGKLSQAEQHEVQHVVSTLLRHCTPFLHSVSHLSSSALLWRGHTTVPYSLFRASPAPDLLDAHTYGPDGASFFQQLDVALCCTNFQTSSVAPRPMRAHIGTGDRNVAAEWGIPLSVWPCGEARYAFRERGGFIYTPGDSIQSADERRGPLVFEASLRNALLHGSEVMFECPAFYILPDRLLVHVVRQLDDALSNGFTLAAGPTCL